MHGLQQLPTKPTQACRCAPRPRLPCTAHRIARHSNRRLLTTILRAASFGSCQALLEHVKRTGGTLDKVAVEESLATGLPVLVAAADISPGDTIMSVPETAWLPPAKVQQSAIGPSIVGLEPWLQIALYILHVEHTRTDDPYVAALPAVPSSVLLWSDEELEALRGTQLLENALAYKQFFLERYSSLQESLFSKNADLFPPQTFSLDNFIRAAATVRSRLHPPLEGADATLVPLADMVAHKRGVSTKWKLGSTGLINRKQVLTVEAGKQYRKGEALTMDYGPDKVDNQLLLDYGVFDAGEKQEGYVLTLNMVQDRFQDDKADILESAGLGQSAQFVLRPGQDPEPDMLAFLRLMQLQKQDVFLLEPIFREEVWGHLQMPVSDFNEELVCKAMVAGAAEALAQYPTTLERDLRLARSGALERGSRQELAVQARLSEKEALNATLLWFEQRLSQLSTLEYYQERRLKRLGLLDEKGRTTYDGFFKGGIA